MIGRGRQPERFLATILFTDIVGSTDLAASLGDRAWRRLLAAHHGRVRAQLRQFGGREVDTAGDGFMCSFDQPAQAVRAADAILTDVAGLGLQLRAGIHTGEAEKIGPKIGGIAVHIAARVMALAVGGHVLVSSTVRDLVAGSGLEFTDAGTHELKGVPGEWHLYALTRRVEPVVSEVAVPAEPTSPRRRRTRLVALGALLTAAGIGVVLAAALALGLLNPGGSTLPPGPDTVVTIDAAGNQVVDVHPVPAGPSAIAIDTNSMRAWVASLDAGVVTDFATTGSPQDRTTGRVGRPTDLVVGDGLIWVADAFDKAITLVDASTGAPRRTVEDVVARQIAYGFGSAWATDDISDRLLRLDGQTGDVAQAVDVGPGAFPAGLAVGEDAIWIANSGTSTLARVDARSVTLTLDGIALRAVPDTVVANAETVWIASRGGDLVMRVDPVNGTLSQTVDVGDQPVSLAIDGETVWVGCAGTREVWHLASDGTLLAKVDVGGVPSDLSVWQGRVYVTVREE